MIGFSGSWASANWVIVAEIFTMANKSAAMSTCTAVLFLAGAVTNALFLSLYDLLSGALFLLFAGISAAGGLYVYMKLPETMGRSLSEIQGFFAAMKADREEFGWCKYQISRLPGGHHCFRSYRHRALEDGVEESGDVKHDQEEEVEEVELSALNEDDRPNHHSEL
eukprot:TRINITY_DN14306_c0_g1_i1.p1 TRINITY_DN14306_c0_g1~~TRINITY_DN14306_c0_g1_i1.p1  ORF type:complete len:166 (-),score=29.40 TRINITY_DN14306_c0_g1_i1:347-844(-)